MKNNWTHVKISKEVKYLLECNKHYDESFSDEIKRLINTEVNLKNPMQYIQQEETTKSDSSLYPSNQTVEKSKKSKLPNHNFSSRQILLAHAHNAHVSIKVSGKKGSGKTTYALQTMFKVFRHMGHDIETSWELAVDHLIFDRDDFIRFLEKRIAIGEQAPVITLDDARSHMNNALWKTKGGQNDIDSITTHMDTIRTNVAGLILTMPAEDGMLGVLRNDDGYIAMIQRKKNYGPTATATIYETYHLPSGTVGYPSPKAKDTFDIDIPDKWYNKSNQKRRKFQRKKLEQLKQAKQEYDNEEKGL